MGTVELTNVTQSATCSLKPVNPRHQPLNITLANNESFRFGRNADCEQSFPTDYRLSRVHCSLRLEAGIFVVEDSSVNGTYVNGIRLQRNSRTPLSRGDQLFLVIPDDALLTSGYTGSLKQNFVGYIFDQEMPSVTLPTQQPSDLTATTAATNATDPSSPSTLREGWMDKLPVSSSFGAWQRRWMVLCTDHIEWRASASSAAKGHIALANATVTLDNDSAPKLLHIRRHKLPQLALRAPTSEPTEKRQQLLREWHTAVEAVVQQLADGLVESTDEPDVSQLLQKPTMSATPTTASAPAPAAAAGEGPADTNQPRQPSDDTSAPLHEQHVSFAAWWLANLAYTHVETDAWAEACRWVPPSAATK